MTITSRKIPLDSSCDDFFESSDHARTMGNAISTSPAKQALPPRGPKGRRRDLVVQPNDRRFVSLTQHWQQATVLGTGPSIFTPSPKELSIAAQIARSKLTYVMRLRIDANKRPPPPGSVSRFSLLRVSMDMHLCS
jgi:hypothetical protein